MALEVVIADQTKMKLSLILSLTLSLIFLVSQVSGAVFTQTQIDSINPNTYNLQCQRELVQGADYEISSGQFVIGFSCLNIARLTDTTYNVTKTTFYPHFRILDYFQCKVSASQQVCVNRYVAVLQSQIDTYKTSVRTKLKFFQTQDENEINTNFGNINPTP